MANIHQDITELIGNTPLLEVSKAFDSKAHIIGKVEYFNPAGSVKDRIAWAMIEEAEKTGKLTKGATIIEPTSGNTGVALAAIAAARGYKAIIVMPSGMSIERRKLQQIYGAQLVLVDNGGMTACVAKAKELAEQTPNSWVPSQFTNPVNPAVHEKTTGPEIWRDTDGKVDVFIAGVGTGGTLSGVGHYLKKQNPAIRIVAVEPAASPVLSTGKGGVHKIQGIGPGFVADTLDTSIYDEIITVSNEDSFTRARQAAGKLGLLVGISAGAALQAAIEVGARDGYEGKSIVAILPDTGERYFSTDLFNLD